MLFARWSKEKKKKKHKHTYIAAELLPSDLQSVMKKTKKQKEKEETNLLWLRV